jgi:hypothetical protein
MVSGSLCLRRAVPCCGDLPRSSAQRGCACGEGEARNNNAISLPRLTSGCAHKPSSPIHLYFQATAGEHPPYGELLVSDCCRKDTGLAPARMSAAARTETGGKWLTVVVVLLLGRHGGVQLPPRFVLVSACVRPGSNSGTRDHPTPLPRFCLFPPELTPGTRTNQHAIPLPCLARSGALNPRRKVKEAGKRGRSHPRPNSGRAPTQGRTRTSSHTHTPACPTLRGRGNLSKTVW